MDTERLKTDLLALGLLALVVFVGLSFLSYDPADPPSTLVFPSRQSPTNICGEVGAALDKIKKAITDEKWPYHYRIAWLHGGADTLRIVVPMKSYAEMAEPNPTVHAVLAKALGSEDSANATMKQFGSSFESGDYTVFAYRPDLSTQK